VCAQRAGLRQGQADDRCGKQLVLTHLIPYPENTVVRAMYTDGMSDLFQGEITVAEDGMVLAF
jgi:ribonuclease Z